MSIHPEMNEGPFKEVVEAVSNSDTCDVWCKGCQAFRKCNAAYAKFLKGEIESCQYCGDK